MHQFSANSAGASARAALWSWHAGDGVLVIRADPGNPLASLDGRWTLQALLEQFDGLARMRIATPLKSGRPGDPVDIRVTLLNGAPAHFFGAFHDLGVARGLIVKFLKEPGFLDHARISLGNDAETDHLIETIRSLVAGTGTGAGVKAREEPA